MAETAFSAVEHALENQPVGGLQISGSKVRVLVRPPIYQRVSIARSVSSEASEISSMGVK